ncbi:hypothetical protein PtB15_3B570 [Puccinia triticina]|nr:hypothetical protein PtB15_3B570 [Puccinia triticina]
MNNLIFANKENFDDIINNNFQTAEVRDISVKYPAKRTSLRKRKMLDNERPALEVFKAQLIADLHEDYNSQFEAGGPLCDEDIFGEEEANVIVSYMHHIHTPNDIRGIIGGQCYEGQLTWLFNQITKFKISLEGDTVCGRAAPKRLKLSLPLVQTPSKKGAPKSTEEVEVITAIGSDTFQKGSTKNQVRGIKERTKATNKERAGS